MLLSYSLTFPRPTLALFPVYPPALITSLLSLPLLLTLPLSPPFRRPTPISTHPSQASPPQGEQVLTPLNHQKSFTQPLHSPTHTLHHNHFFLFQDSVLLPVFFLFLLFSPFSLALFSSTNNPDLLFDANYFNSRSTVDSMVWCWQPGGLAESAALGLEEVIHPPPPPSAPTRSPSPPLATTAGRLARGRTSLFPRRRLEPLGERTDAAAVPSVL